MSQIKADEIVVIIDHPKNSDVLFSPANVNLRSRILPSRLYGAPPQYQKFSMSGIPGQRIHLNAKKREGRITDTLADDENKQLLEDLKTFRAQLDPPKYDSDPVDEIVKKNLTEEDVATWLFWMVRLVEREEAELVQGKLPSIKELKESGKVRRTRLTKSARVPDHIMTEEKEQEFIDNLR